MSRESGVIWQGKLFVLFAVALTMSGCATKDSFIESPLVKDGYMASDDVKRLVNDSQAYTSLLSGDCVDVGVGSSAYAKYLDEFVQAWSFFEPSDVSYSGTRQAIQNDVLNMARIRPCALESGEIVVFLDILRRSISGKGSSPRSQFFLFRRDVYTGRLILQDRSSVNSSVKDKGGVAKVFVELSQGAGPSLTLTSLNGLSQVSLERMPNMSIRASIPVINFDGSIKSMLDLVLESDNGEAEAAKRIVIERSVNSARAREAEERRKNEISQQKSEFWSGVGSALYTGLQAANEVMAEKTAQSQAELDATLRAVNAQAAAERQQEAEAAAEAQAERRYQAEQQAAYNAALAQGYSQAEASRQADAQAEAAKQREAAQAHYARQQAERERRIAEQEREAQLNAQRVMQRFTESSSLAAAAGASGASQEVREYRIERTSPALAWCYQYPTGGRFKCDGPLQRMSSSETSFRYALEIVGCGDAGASESEPAPGASEKYYCGRSLSSTDRVMLEESPFQ